MAPTTTLREHLIYNFLRLLLVGNDMPYTYTHNRSGRNSLNILWLTRLSVLYVGFSREKDGQMDCRYYYDMEWASICHNQMDCEGRVACLYGFDLCTRGGWGMRIIIWGCWNTVLRSFNFIIKISILHIIRFMLAKLLAIQPQLTPKALEDSPCTTY